MITILFSATSGISCGRRGLRRRLGTPPLNVPIVDLAQGRVEIAGQLPAWIVGLELAEIRDPPAMVTNPWLLGEDPMQLTARDLLAVGDRLEHRAVGGASAAKVVDSARARRRVERSERRHDVRRVDVIPDLFSAIADNRVGLAGDSAAHQERQEAVQLRAGMIGP